MSRQMDIALLHSSLAGAESDKSEETNEDCRPFETDSHIESSRETGDPIPLGGSDKSKGGIDTINGTLGFFKLPRELRDQIYDLLYVRDRETRADEPRKDGCLTHLAITTHSTVSQAFHLNRQFRSEYIQRSKMPVIVNHTVLHTNINLNHRDSQDQTCPPFARGTTHLDIKFEEYIFCAWCHGRFMFSDSHFRLIAKFSANMPAVESVKLHFYFSPAPHRNWDCRNAYRKFVWWESTDKHGKHSVESLASGSRPCWSERPEKTPNLEICWYCRVNSRLEDAVLFGKWTKEGGLQLYFKAARRASQRWEGD